jgi:acetoacetyl-CoA synthetase
MASSGQTAWKHPDPHSTRMHQFRNHVNRKYNLSLKDYSSLQKWTTDELETFCAEIWDFCGVVHSVPPTNVANGIETMWPRPEWFPGARLNYTENILATGLAARPDAIAISACREGGTNWRHMSWKQLRQSVEECTSGLRALGVEKGDRVAGMMQCLFRNRTSADAH